MSVFSVMLACALMSLGAWLALAFVRPRGAVSRPSKMMRVTPLVAGLLFSVAALANVTSGPINTLPKVNIPNDTGAANAKGYSTDPQIAKCVVDATGVTATTTSLTVFADSAHMTCTTLAGAIVSDSTTGYITIARSGLYRVHVGCNGTGTTTNTMTEEASISTDGGSTFTQVSGANAIGVALTADLSKNMNAQGYVSVTSGQAAAGTTVIVARGKNSANTTTCISGEVLSVERVNTLLPYAYP